MTGPGLFVAGLAMTTGCLLAGCAATPTGANTKPSVLQAEKQALTAYVVGGPSGWSSRKSISPTSGNEDCLTQPGFRASGWRASDVKTWSRSPIAPTGGSQSIRTVQVCLSLFASRADAAVVQHYFAQQINASEHPSGVPPSSVPVPVEILHVPGAIGSFLDFSTAGQEVIYFAKDNFVVRVLVMCDAEGGTSCAAGETMAQQQFKRLPS